MLSLHVRIGLCEDVDSSRSIFSLLYTLEFIKKFHILCFI